MNEQDTAQILQFCTLDESFETMSRATSPLRSDLLKRLLLASTDAATDCEVLEVALLHACGSTSAAMLANKLIERFGTLNKVLNADSQQLYEVEGVDSAVIEALAVVRQVVLRVLKSEVSSQPVLDRLSTLLDYCRFASGQNRVEEMRVLFLNQAHMLIADEMMFRGTVNHAPIYPREIVKRALELSASAIIVVRSRPNYQQVTPSKSEIDITTQILRAATTVNITLHDHIIFSDFSVYSFKKEGLFDGKESPVPAQVQLSLF